MNNKYYTPEIEEFHVGFEFESNYISFSKDGNWTKVILGKNDINYEEISWFYTSYIGDAVPTEFRVKHLDREDIESLGWEHTGGKMSPGATQYYEKNGMSLDYSENNKILSIYSERYNWETCKFDGTVRNKSELKKVLKMIGV